MRNDGRGHEQARSLRAANESDLGGGDDCTFEFTPADFVDRIDNHLPSTSGSMVTIGVEDDGSDVPPADRERLFDRFVRLDAARDRASGGSGLGLAVVRAAAVAHGGDVRIVESHHGGASVEAWLPAAPD